MVSRLVENWKQFPSNLWAILEGRPQLSWDVDPDKGYIVCWSKLGQLGFTGCLRSETAIASCLDCHPAPSFLLGSYKGQAGVLSGVEGYSRWRCFIEAPGCTPQTPPTAAGPTPPLPKHHTTILFLVSKHTALHFLFQDLLPVTFNALIWPRTIKVPDQWILFHQVICIPCVTSCL